MFRAVSTLESSGEPADLFHANELCGVLAHDAIVGQLPTCRPRHGALPSLRTAARIDPRKKERDLMTRFSSRARRPFTTSRYLEPTGLCRPRCALGGQEPERTRGPSTWFNRPRPAQEAISQLLKCLQEPGDSAARIYFQLKVADALWRTSGSHRAPSGTPRDLQR